MHGYRRLSGKLMKILPGVFVIIQLMLAIPDLWAGSSTESERIAGIVARMTSAYAQLEQYQSETVVNVYREGKVVETQHFLYTFKKPDHMRIDMRSPHPGMVLVFPDKNGKVLVKPGGWTGFLKFHLSPDNALLKNSAGQRIDQTDMGLLVSNIAHSLTDRRRGEIKLSREEGKIILEVLADDHFLAGVQTLYRFSIDQTRWLPTEVEEFTPDGIPKRKVVFRNFKTPVMPDSFFLIDGGNPGNDQSVR